MTYLWENGPLVQLHPEPDINHMSRWTHDELIGTVSLKRMKIRLETNLISFPLTSVPEEATRLYHCPRCE